MIRRNRTGEPIPLDEEAGCEYTDDLYCRGHVCPVTLEAAAASWLDEVPEMGPIRHVWARWVFDGSIDGSPCRVLNEYSQRGRGMFAVTAATDAWLLRRAAENRAQEDRDVAELLARYPGAEVTRRSGCGRDYRLRVPGCGSAVRVGWQDWRDGRERGEPEVVTMAVWPVRSDVAAWETFRATCPEYKETE